MSLPRPTIPPPSRGKPALLVLLLLGIAGAAGLVTWLVVGGEQAPPPAPPPTPARPQADLLVLPDLDLPRDADAGPFDAAADAEVDEDAPAKAPAKGGGRRVGANGTIDARRVTAFIRTKQGEVRRCYERRLKMNNALQGVLDAQITIQPSGRVSNVNFTQDTIYDGEIRSCVAQAIRTWQFPEPEGGSVTVSNLFRFSPRLD